MRWIILLVENALISKVGLLIRLEVLRRVEKLEKLRHEERGGRIGRTIFQGGIFFLWNSGNTYKSPLNNHLNNR